MYHTQNILNIKLIRSFAGACCFILFFGNSFQSLAQDSTSTFYHYSKVGYQYDFFDTQLSDWHSGIVELKFQGKSLSYLPRLTIGNRFDQTSFLLENEFYQSFKNDDYLMIGLGFSPDKIFVRRYAIAEYYNPFGKWEYSGGVKWMNFADVGDLGVFTGSLSSYYGSFLTIVRANLAYGFSNEDFSNFAVILFHRYYISDTGYLGFNASYGYDNNLILISDQANLPDGKPYLLSMGLVYNSPIKKRHRWTLSYNWTNYNLILFNRTQHTFSLYYTLYEKD